MDTQSTPPIQQPVFNDDEMFLIPIFKTFWSGRKTILKTIIIAFTLGLIIAFISPTEYLAWTSMVPQTSQSEGKLGGLSSLAAMAGFNLDMNSSVETISPMVYPQIVNSVPFQLELMNIPFSFSNVEHPVSLYEYYSKKANHGFLPFIRKYTLELPGRILSTIHGETLKSFSTETKGPISLSKDQEKVRKLIERKVTITLDAKQGYLKLKAYFPEALLSAQVADQARELLQKYITRYKVQKATDKLAFIEERFNERKKEFLKAQERLARFRDENKNMSSAMARTEEESLQNDYSISLNVINELSKQLEQAKIQVKEETPIFSVLQPAMVPQEKVKPQKAIIIAIWLFFGLIVGIGIVFGKEFINDLQIKWDKSNLNRNAN